MGVCLIYIDVPPTINAHRGRNFVELKLVSLVEISILVEVILVEIWISVDMIVYD